MLVLSSGCLNSHGVLWLVAAHQDGLNGTHCLHYITFFSPGVSLETMSLRGTTTQWDIGTVTHTHTRICAHALFTHWCQRAFKRRSGPQHLPSSVSCQCNVCVCGTPRLSCVNCLLRGDERQCEARLGCFTVRRHITAFPTGSFLLADNYGYSL